MIRCPPDTVGAQLQERKGVSGAHVWCPSRTSGNATAGKHAQLCSWSWMCVSAQTCGALTVPSIGQDSRPLGSSNSGAALPTQSRPRIARNAAAPLSHGLIFRRMHRAMRPTCVTARAWTDSAEGGGISLGHAKAPHTCRHRGPAVDQDPPHRPAHAPQQHRVAARRGRCATHAPVAYTCPNFWSFSGGFEMITPSYTRPTLE